MVKRSIERIEGWISIMGGTINWIAMVFLFLMMLLTVAHVFLRYAFNSPINGFVEMISLIMIVIGYFAFVWCTIKGGHVKVEMLSWLPSAPRTFLDGVFYLVCSGICFLTSWQNCLQAKDMLFRGQASALLRIPSYPFYIVIAISFGIVSLALFVGFIQIVAKAVGKWE